MENSCNICWNLGKVEKSSKKCEKWKNLVNVLKSGKFGIILKNIFHPGKMKNGKFLKNLLEFGENEKIW